MAKKIVGLDNNFSGKNFGAKNDKNMNNFNKKFQPNKIEKIEKKNCPGKCCCCRIARKN